MLKEMNFDFESGKVIKKSFSYSSILFTDVDAYSTCQRRVGTWSAAVRP
jgi:hypothetical protein